MYLCAELENKPPAKIKLSGVFGEKRPSFFQLSPKESAQQMPFYLKTLSTATAPSLFPSHSILCSMNDLLQLFIFAQTPLEELRAWLAATPHRFARFAPGERIIAQGAECRSALLLTAGKANTEMVQDGRDLSIDVLKAPMLLASAFLFGSENRMPVSVTAATECEVWTVNKESLFDFMLQHPEAMRRFVAEVSDRTQFLSRRLRQLTLQSLRSRVLDFLHERGRMESVQTAAQQLGVQRPSLSRVLSDLVAEGRVEKRDGAFVAVELPSDEL